MPHRKPQGWFSDGAPPTDELKSQVFRRLSACAGRDIHVPTRPACNRPPMSDDRCRDRLYLLVTD